MGFARGLTAGSNMMTNVLNGASQRRERDQVMEIRQTEEDRTEFNEVKKAYQGMTIDPATGERRAHGDLVNDPAYQEIMLKLSNTNYARKKLFNDREVIGAIPTEDGNATIAVRGDDGKPKPFTLFGTREGDPGSEDDPIISLRPEQLAMNFEKLLPYLDAETNVSEGILNAGLRAGMAGDFSKLEQMGQGGEQPPAQLGQGVSQANVSQTESGKPKINDRTYTSFSEIPAEYQTLASKVGQKHGIEPAMLLALASRESDFDPKAKNKESGATGIGQFVEATAKSLGIDPNNPEESFEGMAALIKEAKGAGYSDQDIFRYYFAGPNKKGWGEKTEAYGEETQALYETYRNDMSNVEPELGNAELGGGDVPEEEPARLGATAEDHYGRRDRLNAETNEQDLQRMSEEDAARDAERTARQTGKNPPAPDQTNSFRKRLGEAGDNIAEVAGRTEQRVEDGVGSSVGAIIGTGVNFATGAAEVAATVAKEGYGVLKDTFKEELGHIADSYKAAREGGASDSEAVDAVVAKETDSTPKKVNEEMAKPVDETDLATADAALDGQVAAFSERGMTDKQAEAIMKRAQREDSAKAYSGALAVGVSMGLITLPQAHDMLMKTQQTGMSLKEYYQTEKARLDVVKMELELANERNSAHLNTTEAGAQLRNQENLIKNITGRLNMSTRITMSKVRNVFGVELSDEQMMTSVLGMVSVDPVMAEILVPGLDVNALLNGDRNVDLGKDEVFLIGELMTQQLDYMYGGKGEKRFFKDKKPDFSVFSKLATPESMKTGSVKLQDGSTMPVLDIVRNIYSNPETPLEYKKQLRGMSNAELIKHLQSYAE